MLKEKVIGLELKVRIIGHCQVEVIEIRIFLRKNMLKQCSFECKYKILVFTATLILRLKLSIRKKEILIKKIES